MYPSCAAVTQAAASSARACGATPTGPSRTTTSAAATSRRTAQRRRAGGGEEEDETAVGASADTLPDRGVASTTVDERASSASASARAPTTTRTTRRSALLSTAAASIPWATSSSSEIVASTASARVASSTAATTAASALAQPRAASAAVRPLAVVRSEPVAASAGEISLSIALPPGYHLTMGANSRFEVEVVGKDNNDGDVDDKATESPLKVKPTAGKLVEGQEVRLKFSADSGGGGGGGGGEVRANCTVYFCREDDICLLQRVRFEVPVLPTEGGVNGGGVGGGGGVGAGAGAAAALRFEVSAAETPGALRPANPVAASPAPVIPSLDDL